MSTNLAPERVIKKAIEFFEKLGLEITQRSANSLCMEGGGGHVTLTICPEDHTEVDIMTEEWDAKVKEFIQRIAS